LSIAKSPAYRGEVEAHEDDLANKGIRHGFSLT
jgi:hypothetical protein